MRQEVRRESRSVTSPGQGACPGATPTFSVEFQPSVMLSPIKAISSNFFSHRHFLVFGNFAGSTAGIAGKGARVR